MKKLFLLIAALSLLAPLARAQSPFNQTSPATNCTSVSTCTATLTNATLDGDIAVVAGGAAYDSGTTITSMTGCGATWTPLYVPGRQGLWWGKLPAQIAGGCSVSVNFSTATAWSAINITSYRGLIYPFTVETYSAGINNFYTSFTLSATILGTNDLAVIPEFWESGATTITNSAGWTQRVNQDTNGNAGVGVADITASAGTVSNTVTFSPGRGLTARMIVFRSVKPTVGDLQSTCVSCTSTTGCQITLPATQPGDLAWVPVQHPSCASVNITSSNGQATQAPPAESQCQIYPFVVPLTGGDTTFTVNLGPGAIPPQVCAHELTGLPYYYDGSALGIGTYTNPMTIRNIRGSGTCYAFLDYQLGDAATTASPGYIPAYPTLNPTFDTGTYVYWDQLLVGGSPYANTANLVTGTIYGQFGMYTFCSNPFVGPNALQGNWTGSNATQFAYPEPVHGGSDDALICHIEGNSTAPTSSPANMWTLAGGALGAQFTDYVAFNAAAGPTTVTLNGGGGVRQGMCIEVKGITGLRNAGYTPPSSTQNITVSVAANAGDYVLFTGSCAGAHIGCIVKGDNSTNGSTLRQDGAFNDDAGAQMFEQIAGSTGTYSMPFSLSSGTGSSSAAGAYAFIPTPVPTVQTQMFGNAQMLGNAQVIP